MNIAIDPIIGTTGTWADKVQRANKILELDLGEKYIDQAAGRWTVEKDDDNQPRLVLEMTDSLGIARRRFTDADFYDSDRLWWRLHFLWTDVLRDAAHKLQDRLEKSFQIEEPTNHA